MFMEAANIICGIAKHINQLWIQRIKGSIKFCLCGQYRIRADIFSMVKFSGKAGQSGIAIAAHGLNNRVNSGRKKAEIIFGAAQ